MEQISRAAQLEQKRTYWKQHIESWQQTGLTQTEYRRQHNSPLQIKSMVDYAVFHAA